MSDPAPRPRVCRDFRTKAMFSREGGRDQLRVDHETVDFPFCWCARSATELGPDDRLAGPEACARTERECYRR